MYLYCVYAIFMIGKKIRAVPVIIEFNTVKTIISKRTGGLLKIIYFILPRIKITLMYFS